MLDMEITYPECIATTQEEREFDSFVLSYVLEKATVQGSPNRTNS